jgi:hypothetical protein
MTTAELKPGASYACRDNIRRTLLSLSGTSVKYRRGRETLERSMEMQAFLGLITAEAAPAKTPASSKGGSPS